MKTAVLQNNKFVISDRPKPILDEYGDVEGLFGCPFLEYEESNIGITWWHEDGDEPEESDDEDDE